ncbi:MAG: tetratricopeptide repeat-containing sensor histidine kinase [Tenuifilaceae bacterium]|nr:tetratricopeptide repeat-containing sensor histidine kinase [Tenuifilaceae bacterium]
MKILSASKKRFMSGVTSLFLLVLLSIQTQIFAQQTSTLQQAQFDAEQGREFEQKSDHNQASFFYNKAASSFWALGNLDAAKENFLKALTMSEKIGNHNAIYILNTNLGLINAESGKLNDALNHFIKASNSARQMGRKADLAASLLNQANVLYELGNYTNAIEVLKTAEGFAHELNDSKMLRNSYSIYTKVFDKMGKREESAKYFELFAAITRKIQREEMQKKEEEANKMVSQAASRIKAVEAEKQATEKELEVKDMELVEKQMMLEKTEQVSREQLMQIDLLNKERELQQAIITHQNQMRNVYLVIIAMVLAFSVFIYYNYREKKKANLMLQQKNTEISRQNTEIQAQAQQLRELNQLKDKLFSIISHDLRSPLGSLITLLNLTQQGYFTEEGFKEVIDELSKNVGYTTELLENLLRWAQSQMQGLKVNPSDFALHEVAQEKFKLYQEHAQNKGITLKNQIDPNLTVYADSAMIELVFRNLIANSIKFCNSGSVVRAAASVANGKVLVSVSDTGQGISPENLKKIFGNELFSTRGTANEKGTGLGLTLCKDFITLNGGEIWVKSVEGVGSEFFFTLPLQLESKGG